VLKDSWPERAYSFSLISIKLSRSYKSSPDFTLGIQDDKRTTTRKSPGIYLLLEQSRLRRGGPPSIAGFHTSHIPSFIGGERKGGARQGRIHGLDEERELHDTSFERMLLPIIFSDKVLNNPCQYQEPMDTVQAQDVVVFHVCLLSCQLFN
jgi:hypothetical protein